MFIKNTLKVHVKFTPTCFGTQTEPSSGGQHLILAKVRGLLEKYPTFGREKETGLLGALDT